MDYGKAFTYMTEDEQWLKKLVIGGLLVIAALILMPLLLAGIVPLLILSGYLIELLQNVMRGQPRPLPEWDNAGAKFMKGLNALVIGLVYSAPILLALCCYLAVTIATGAGGDSGRNGSASDTAVAIFSLASFCFYCFAFVYGLSAFVFSQAAVTLYAANERLADAFKFGDVWGYIRNNLQNFIIALILAYGAQFIAQFGIIACFIGAFFTAVWAAMVQYHLLGQVYYTSLNPPLAPPAAPPPMPDTPAA